MGGLAREEVRGEREAVGVARADLLQLPAEECWLQDTVRKGAQRYDTERRKSDK